MLLSPVILAVPDRNFQTVPFAFEIKEGVGRDALHSLMEAEQAAQIREQSAYPLLELIKLDKFNLFVEDQASNMRS